jgi:polysaccharide biosynthesis/export protein VpsN
MKSICFAGQWLWQWLGGCVVAVLLLGCQSGPRSSHAGSTNQSPPNVGGQAAFHEGDVLRVGDPVTISFSGPDQTPPSFSERIKADGTIRLPLVTEPIVAAGKSRGALEEEILNRYVPRIFKRMTVKVGSEGRVVTVSGQVRMPGRVPFLGGMTVLKAVAAAGDFTDFADRKRVLITRVDGTQVVVDCKKAARDPKRDVPIYPDDLIEVPRRIL